MSKKSPLVFITTELPWPPTSGGRIKTYRFLKFLAEYYEVHLLCAYCMNLSDVRAFQDDTAVQNVMAFHHQKQRSAIHWVNSLRFPTFSTYRVFSRELQYLVHAALGMIDTVVVDHLAMMRLIPDCLLNRVIYHSHNAEFRLWEDLASLEMNPMKKAIMQWEAGRVRQFERRVIRGSRFTFAAPNDQQVLMRKLMLGEERFRHTCHLGNDALLSLAAPEVNTNEARVFYAGTLSWVPNSDGLKWFLTSVWENVRRVVKDARLVVCGAGATDDLRELIMNTPGVDFMGFVDDLEAEMSRCRVAIVPLRFGSGMKIKTFDALYRGVPLVTTPVGAEGIALEHNKHALIADNPVDFASHVTRLLRSPAEGVTLAAHGRALAASRYRYESLLEGMLGAMLDAPFVPATRSMA